MKNSLNFLSSENVLISLSLLKEVFTNIEFVYVCMGGKLNQRLVSLCTTSFSVLDASGLPFFP